MRTMATTLAVAPLTNGTQRLKGSSPLRNGDRGSAFCLSISHRRLRLVRGATDVEIHSDVHGMVYDNAALRGAVSSDCVIGLADALLPCRTAPNSCSSPTQIVLGLEPVDTLIVERVRLLVTHRAYGFSLRENPAVPARRRAAGAGGCAALRS